MTDRRLAAIMFTDIVGYTAMMGENEPKTLQLLETNRKIQKPLIEIYHGELLKEMGDGMLASFTSVSDAVHCAQEILRISKEEADLKLHIGIHLGEVVFSDGDVFGDGVNIASRIESTAKEGEIYISEDVWKNIKNKEDLPVEFVGKKTFKNVKEPVGLYKIKEWISPVKSQQTKTRSIKWKKFGIISTSIFISALAVYLLFNTTNLNTSIPASDSPKSIALFPLQNISDEENNYLATGIQSEIAMALRNVPGLKVYAGMDVEQMVSKNLTKKQIGERLNVASILEGTVWKEGNRFRLSLLLTDIKTDEILWNDSYDREYDRLMNVVSEVATKLAASIQIAITTEERSRMNFQPTSSPEAFDLNLKGWQLRSLAFSFPVNKDSLRAVAKELAMKALEHDPDYIYPYELIASVELDRGNYDTLRIIGEQMIRKFPQLEGGYIVLAGMHYEYGNYEDAFQNYQKAYSLEPNEPWTNIQLGNIYCYVKKDYLKGIPYLIKGNELTPKPGTLISFGWVAPAYRSIGDYKNALQWSMRWFNHSQSCGSLQNVVWDYILMGKEVQSLHMLDSLCGSSECDNCEQLYLFAHLYNGNIDQAIKLMKKGVLGNSGGERYWKAYLNIKMGNKQEAKRILDNLKTEIQSNYVEGRFESHEIMLAGIHELLGDKEAALKWLRKWEQTGFLYGSHEWMMKPGFFDSMKNDPEFISIYERNQKEKAEIRAKIREMEEQGELDL